MTELKYIMKEMIPFLPVTGVPFDFCSTGVPVEQKSTYRTFSISRNKGINLSQQVWYQISQDTIGFQCLKYRDSV